MSKSQAADAVNLHPNACYMESFDDNQLFVYRAHRAVDHALEVLRLTDEEDYELFQACYEAQVTNIQDCYNTLTRLGVNPTGCVDGLRIYLTTAFVEYTDARIAGVL